jgi:hypothetical protein
MDPAVAANGLPVIAIQCLPCKGGFCVGCADTESMDIKDMHKQKLYELIFLNIINGILCPNYSRPI